MENHDSISEQFLDDVQEVVQKHEAVQIKSMIWKRACAILIEELNVCDESVAHLTGACFLHAIGDFEASDSDGILKVALEEFLSEYRELLPKDE